MVYNTRETRPPQAAIIPILDDVCVWQHGFNTRLFWCSTCLCEPGGLNWKYFSSLYVLEMMVWWWRCMSSIINPTHHDLEIFFVFFYLWISNSHEITDNKSMTTPNEGKFWCSKPSMVCCFGLNAVQSMVTDCSTGIYCGPTGRPTKTVTQSHPTETNKSEL